MAEGEAGRGIGVVGERAAVVADILDFGIRGKRVALAERHAPVAGQRLVGGGAFAHHQAGLVKLVLARRHLVVFGDQAKPAGFGLALPAEQQVGIFAIRADDLVGRTLDVQAQPELVFIDAVGGGQVVTRRHDGAGDTLLVDGRPWAGWSRAPRSSARSPIDGTRRPAAGRLSTSKPAASAGNASRCPTRCDVQIQLDLICRLRHDDGIAGLELQVGGHVAAGDQVLVVHRQDFLFSSLDDAPP